MKTNLKVGDLVKWIGYPGADKEGVKITGPRCDTGVVVKLIQRHNTIERLDVYWSDGTFGIGLYPQTVARVSL